METHESWEEELVSILVEYNDKLNPKFDAADCEHILRLMKQAVHRRDTAVTNKLKSQAVGSITSPSKEEHSYGVQDELYLQGREHATPPRCEHDVPNWASCPACPNTKIISALEEAAEDEEFQEAFENGDLQDEFK